MEKIVKQLNEELSKGILPDDLNFSLKREYELDINKIKYNAFYRTYDYYADKFPPGFDNIPGFDKIIESIVEQNQNITPLQELEKLQNLEDKNISINI